MNKNFCLQVDSTSNYRFLVQNFFSTIMHTLFLSPWLILACTSLVNILFLCDSA